MTEYHAVFYCEMISSGLFVYVRERLVFVLCNSFSVFLVKRSLLSCLFVSVRELLVFTLCELSLSVSL